MLIIITGFLLRSPCRKDQPTLPHCGLCCGRVYFAGNVEHAGI